MEKTVVIQGKEYKLKSSLGTVLKYREIFGTELFSDVKIIDSLKGKAEDEISRIINVIFRITYVLHRPYTDKTYDQFLDDLDFSIIGDPKALDELAKAIGELIKVENKTNKVTP